MPHKPYKVPADYTAIDDVPAKYQNLRYWYIVNPQFHRLIGSNRPYYTEYFRVWRLRQWVELFPNRKPLVTKIGKPTFVFKPDLDQYLFTKSDSFGLLHPDMFWSRLSVVNRINSLTMYDLDLTKWTTFKKTGHISYALNHIRRKKLYKTWFFNVEDLKEFGLYLKK